MPHYDYKCTECGYKFELFQKMNEEPVSFCPSCGGKVKRLIGKGAGPIFKGSGFYHTDYKNNTGKPAGKKEDSKSSTEQKTEQPAAGDSRKDNKKE